MPPGGEKCRGVDGCRIREVCLQSKYSLVPEVHRRGVAVVGGPTNRNHIEWTLDCRYWNATGHFVGTWSWKLGQVRATLQRSRHDADSWDYNYQCQILQDIDGKYIASPYCLSALTERWFSNENRSFRAVDAPDCHIVRATWSRCTDGKGGQTALWEEESSPFWMLSWM
jgi:hypothetical protein